MNKISDERQPMAVIWVIDGEEKPASDMPRQFVYQDEAGQTVARWEGNFQPVTLENGRYTFRKKATSGVAVSFTDFIQQGIKKAGELAPLHVGAVVVFKGSSRLWLCEIISLADNRTTHKGLTRALEAGEVVYKCKWDGDNLAIVETYTIKTGDAEFVNTGTKLFSTDEPIFSNLFAVTVPGWLRATFLGGSTNG